MAFPAEGGSREQLDDALTKIRHGARSIKTYAQSVRDKSAAGAIQVIEILVMMNDFRRRQDDITRLAQTPGLADHARAAYADAGFDIAAEFTAMRNALIAAWQWVASNAPTDGRWVQAIEIVDGRTVERTLTPAQTAPLRTVLDALIATID